MNQPDFRSSSAVDATLKSALQKYVRRGEVEKAAMIAIRIVAKGLMGVDWLKGRLPTSPSRSRLGVAAAGDEPAALAGFFREPGVLMMHRVSRQSGPHSTKAGRLTPRQH